MKSYVIAVACKVLSRIFGRKKKVAELGEPLSLS
jgi:hypothetical protein